MTNDTLAKLLDGQRVIVSDEWLDSMLGTDAMNDIRTAHNRNRCGIRDAYVAWIADDAAPTDLEFQYDRKTGCQRAVGSL